jgi:hypothetical protein
LIALRALKKFGHFKVNAESVQKAMETEDGVGLVTKIIRKFIEECSETPARFLPHQFKPPEWVADDGVTKCTQCAAEFGLLTRKVCF